RTVTRAIYMRSPYIRICRLKYPVPLAVPIFVSQFHASVRILYTVMKLYPFDDVRLFRTITDCCAMGRDGFIACEPSNLPRFIVVNLTYLRYHCVNAVAFNYPATDN